MITEWEGIIKWHSTPSPSYLFYCRTERYWCSLPGSSVHGIFQARMLEWVAIFHSRQLSGHRDRTLTSCVSCLAGDSLMRQLGSPISNNLFIFHFTASLYWFCWRLFLSSIKWCMNSAENKETGPLVFNSISPLLITFSLWKSFIHN